MLLMKERTSRRCASNPPISIDITDFVDLEQVDPKFFYKPYFLEPQKGGEKPYAVFAQRRSANGQIGIAKVVISNREPPRRGETGRLVPNSRANAFRERKY